MTREHITAAFLLALPEKYDKLPLSDSFINMVNAVHAKGKMRLIEKLVAHKWNPWRAVRFMVALDDYQRDRVTECLRAVSEQYGGLYIDLDGKGKKRIRDVVAHIFDEPVREDGQWNHKE